MSGIIGNLLKPAALFVGTALGTTGLCELNTKVNLPEQNLRSDRRSADLVRSYMDENSDGRIDEREVNSHIRSNRSDELLAHEMALLDRTGKNEDRELAASMVKALRNPDIANIRFGDQTPDPQTKEVPPPSPSVDK